MRSATKHKVSALLLCAGCGSRANLGYNKVLYKIGSKTVLETSLGNLLEAGVDEVKILVSKSDESAVKELVKDIPKTDVLLGGATRTQSAKNGLYSLKDCDIVVIHDGARPYADAALIKRCIDSAKQYGSGIAALPVTDTVKRADASGKVTTLKRDELFSVQTPQVFLYKDIKHAYDIFDGTATDDSEVYEKAGFVPRLVEGSPSNKKITVPADLPYPPNPSLRIGTGFDVHELVEGRRLILGGVDVPYEKGLFGHSDADVAVHAIMDALLSGAGFKDIGVLFPDTDPKYKGADSIKLLAEVGKKVRENGLEINNVSAVIMAQKPKLAPFTDRMRKNLAVALCTDVTQINISATTTENLGITAENKGIAACAVCLLRKAD